MMDSAEELVQTNLIESQIENQLINHVKNLLVELRGNANSRDISLHLSLQNHLGIDSISRVELFHRLEKSFKMQFSERFIAEAETLADIANAIRSNTEALSPQRLVTSYAKMTASSVNEENNEENIDLSSANTLLDVLTTHAALHPDRVHIQLQEEEKETLITYGHLLTSALQVANGLLHRGLKKGETVAIMLPTSSGFFYTFFGILFAGGIPVPIYPPLRLHQIESYAKHESKILQNSNVRFLVTFREGKLLSNAFKAFVPSLKEIVIMDDLGTAKNVIDTIIESEDIALIQYTSGSTSAPKGVTLTHQNLLANIRAYGKAIAVTSKDVVVSWLPLYHDLGLIGNWLGSLYYGSRYVVFSPLTFLNRPEKWLWAIHYHRGTISAGPNFAYETCIRKIDPTMIEGLDLSSWRIAINGAEPIYPKTLHSFTKKFMPYGFKPETLLPVYGLAETSLGLTVPTLGQVPHIDCIDRSIFEKEHRAVAVNSLHHKNTLEFVSCGKVIDQQHIRIVDNANQILPERHVGQIQFQGPSSMRGYYNNLEATKAIFHDGWWDTGDLAYMANEEVFITGRCKDLIIKTGRNFYPSEIEILTAEVDGVRQGCVIAFGITDQSNGTDKLVIVAETTKKNEKAYPSLRSQIIDKITQALNIAPDDVVLVPQRTIPKTSSGKLQRSACKALYLSKKLNKKPLATQLQFFKLAGKWLTSRLFKGLYNVSRFFYTVYIGLIVCASLIPVLLALKLLTQKNGAIIFKKWTQLLCFVSFCPIKIIGKENLHKAKAMIFVSNHISYVDAVLLPALLPPNVHFVAKSELLSMPILKHFFRYLGYLPMHKMDLIKSIEDLKHIQQTLQSERSVLIFPEGTFNYATGLRPFKLGAFKLSAELNMPISPISIQGTRYYLRGNEPLLWPHRIKVTIGEPIYPEGTDLEHIVKLKNITHAEIARHCGEGSLDLIIPAVTGIKKNIN